MKILYKMLVMLGLCAVLSPLAHTSENILDIFERTGVVPEISGGTSGVQYPPPSTGRLGPSNAFDRVTYSSSDNDRWLGDMSKDTFLQIGMPDDSAGYLITLLSYRLHRLSTGWNAWERSPTAWNLYGLDAAGEGVGVQGVAHIDLVPGHDQDLPVALFRMEFDGVEPAALHAGGYQGVVGQDPEIPGVADGAHVALVLLRPRPLRKTEQGNMKRFTALLCYLT